ncbi:hypothetical protein JCM19046_3034 [Bacillus sp. JCM 19046]|nr:hypothetical protein JCM19045_325 [Bacillus sp. JCM 19045]GAF18458.1 hypothetical protein JCM19046_3034 [Bacillus sp. JCM 19046]
MEKNLKIELLDLGVNYQDNIFLNLSNSKIVVLTNIEEGQIVRNNIIVYSLDGQILKEYQLWSEKKIISCIPYQKHFILTQDIEYEDFVSNKEPNVLIWNPEKEVINKFFGGRYINSLAVDLIDTIWIGYDEMGIFSCLKNDISLKGVNRFEINNDIVTICSLDETLDIIDSYSFTYINQHKIYTCYLSKGNSIVCELNEDGLIINKENLSFTPVSLFREKNINYYFYNDPDGS